MSQLETVDNILYSNVVLAGATILDVYLLHSVFQVKSTHSTVCVVKHGSTLAPYHTLMHPSELTFHCHVRVPLCFDTLCWYIPINQAIPSHSCSAIFPAVQPVEVLCRVERFRTYAQVGEVPRCPGRRSFYATPMVEDR